MCISGCCQGGSGALRVAATGRRALNAVLRRVVTALRKDTHPGAEMFKIFQVRSY